MASLCMSSAKNGPKADSRKMRDKNGNKERILHFPLQGHDPNRDGS